MKIQMNMNMQMCKSGNVKICVNVCVYMCVDCVCECVSVVVCISVEMPQISNVSSSYQLFGTFAY